MTGVRALKLAFVPALFGALSLVAEQLFGTKYLLSQSLLGVAMIAAGSRCRLNGNGRVPITGQTFAVCVCGGLQGSNQGAISAALYFALALAGMPVLAPGPDENGIKRTPLHQAHAGFVGGFVPCAWLAGQGTVAAARSGAEGGGSGSAVRGTNRK
mmetsp:Transcript_965/g.1705  ORF Transcript_965/g.1705 Transcript_965/m.1705 type:complete len:156 (+) Transcript_965:156-623(+)